MCVCAHAFQNKNLKADSTLRSSQAVPHPSTNQALRRLTSEVGRDPVHSTRYGRQRPCCSKVLLLPETPFAARATLNKSVAPFFALRRGFWSRAPQLRACCAVARGRRRLQGRRGQEGDGKETRGRQKETGRKQEGDERKTEGDREETGRRQEGDWKETKGRQEETGRRQEGCRKETRGRQKQTARRQEGDEKETRERQKETGRRQEGTDVGKKAVL